MPTRHHLMIWLMALAACVSDKGDTGGPISVDEDADGDGVIASVDCDDADATVFPGAADGCDGLDNDCDGEADEDGIGGAFWYLDADSDGYGNLETVTLACTAPAGHADRSGDCNDGDPAISPASVETCDGLDNDCDGVVDDELVFAIWYADVDGDGYGATSAVDYACEAPDGFVSNLSDCDDEDGEVNPDGVERCDGRDNNCDGLIDNDPIDTPTVYLDYDGDGYGNLAYGATFCTSEEGYATMGGDCDDLSVLSYPGADELCDDQDNDCDGDTDEDPVDGITYYLDADGDGYGGEGGVTSACSLPDGYGSDDSDCDDGDGEVSPGATEICSDGVDNDCDGGKGSCGLDGTVEAGDAEITLFGALASDYLGRAGEAGDVNGDGVTDLLLGAYGVDGSSVSSVGAVYLVLGPVSGGGIDDVAAATITGPTTASYGYAGSSVVAPDLNGDGYADIGSGAYGATTSRGVLAIYYGDSGLGGDLLATDAEATIAGEKTYDYLGYASSNAEDLNGDGLDDLVIGAYGNDAGGTGAGIAYVFYGLADGLTGAASATAADLVIQGDTGGGGTMYLGFSVDTGGDLDGDGLSDLLVGAYCYDGTATDAGGAFLYYGDTGLSGTLTNDDADGIITGSTAYDYLGSRVSGAGDMDGDGYDDILVGSYGTGVGSLADAGVAMIVRGSSSAAIGILHAHASITGVSSYDYLGESVGESGDLDGDGVDDVVVGAYGEDSAYASSGAAYVFFGPVTGTMSASSADATFHGPADGDGYVGRTFVGPMDADGDGANDLIVGGYYVDTEAYDAGAVYVLLGGGL